MAQFLKPVLNRAVIPICASAPAGRLVNFVSAYPQALVGCVQFNQFNACVGHANAHVIGLILVADQVTGFHVRFFVHYRLIPEFHVLNE